MRSHSLIVQLATGLTLSGLAALSPAPAASKLGPDVFGALPQVTSVAIAPDGKRVAWGDNKNEEQRVVIVDIGAQTAARVVPLGKGAKLRRLVWSDDQTLLVIASISIPSPDKKGKNWEFFRATSVNAASGEAHMLLRDAGKGGTVQTVELVAARIDSPDTVVMSSYAYDPTMHSRQSSFYINAGLEQSGWTRSLYKVNTRTGDGKLAEEGSPYISQWALGPDGDAVAYSEWRKEDKRYVISSRTGRRWQEIYRLESGEIPTILGVEPGGASLMLLGRLAGPHRAVWRLPIHGTTVTELLAAKDADFESCDVDPYTGALTACLASGMKAEVHWVDDQARQRDVRLRRAFTDRAVESISESRDHQKVVARVQTGAIAPVFYLIDFATNRANVIGEEYPGLVDQKLGEVREYHYSARDGTDIPAYLTLPPGMNDPKNLPLVVLLHDGPASHDDAGFDWMRQFLASLGYLVFQPQFRGSTGFGNAFRDAGKKQWGGLMQDDVTDGVLALEKQGSADAHRVGIAGIGYGGYAALAGAAFNPDLYACAASINGPGDLPLLVSGQPESWSDEIGSQLDAIVAARSPARATERIHAPILLLHATDDAVVPISQSEGMAAALKRTGKNYKFVRLPGDDHWLSRAATRVEMLHQLQDFLTQYLPPG